jgi:hypothetical protein
MSINYRLYGPIIIDTTSLKGQVEIIGDSSQLNSSDGYHTYGLWLQNPGTSSNEYNSPAIWFKSQTHDEGSQAVYYSIQGRVGSSHDGYLSFEKSSDTTNWSQIFKIGAGGRLTVYGDINIANDNTVIIGDASHGVAEMYLYNLHATTSLDTGGFGDFTVTKGGIANRAHIGDFSAGYSVWTTDGYQSTTVDQSVMWSYTLADNTAYWFEASVVGRDVAGVERAMYGKKVLVYRQSAGSATIQGTVVNLHSDVETSAGLDATFTVSSDDVNLAITGLAATTINWIATIKYQAVSTNS